MTPELAHWRNEECRRGGSGRRGKAEVEPSIKFSKSQVSQERKRKPERVTEWTKRLEICGHGEKRGQ